MHKFAWALCLTSVVWLVSLSCTDSYAQSQQLSVKSVVFAKKVLSKDEGDGRRSYQIDQTLWSTSHETTGTITDSGQMEESLFSFSKSELEIREGYRTLEVLVEYENKGTTSDVVLAFVYNGGPEPMKGDVHSRSQVDYDNGTRRLLKECTGTAWDMLIASAEVIFEVVTPDLPKHLPSISDRAYAINTPELPHQFIVSVVEGCVPRGNGSTADTWHIRYSRKILYPGNWSVIIQEKSAKKPLRVINFKIIE